MTARSHQPELERLLGLCIARGQVVLVTPSHADPHHFYAGVTRPPVTSMLEALLLALGGTLPDGTRRYDEIVVVSAGVTYNEDGKDCPDEEIVRLPVSTGVVTRGDEWRTWCYRTPARPAPPASSASSAASEGITVRPSPRAMARPVSPEYPPYPVDVPGDSGARFPNRHQALRNVVERLGSGGRRALLLVNLAVLDYPGRGAPDRAVIAEHAAIHDSGFQDMKWLVTLIGSSGSGASAVDVVLYTRNGDRAEAFLSCGLPRRPSGWDGQWPAVSYTGLRLPHVLFPCGQFPWGNVFTNDSGFAPADGTARARKEDADRYHERTLRMLLRGGARGAPVTRLRAGNVAPSAPAVTNVCAGLDAAFWSSIDVDAIDTAFRRRYFASGGITCRAVHATAPPGALLDNLFAAMRRLRHLARTAPDSLRDKVVMDQWRAASTIHLFGSAGTGKTMLGQELCPLMYGHEAHVVKGSQIGGGGHGDPSQHLKFVLFGAARPFEGAAELTSTGSHLVRHHGFTVLVLDEWEKAIPGDLQAAFFPLYDLTANRVYTPTNGTRPIPLLNSIVIVTSNLTQWPAAGISDNNLGAIERRLLPWHYAEFSAEQIRRCAEWFLVQHVHDRMEQAAVCYLSHPPAGIEHLVLPARMPSAVKAALDDEGFLARLDRVLETRNLSPDTVPAFLDVAPILEEILVL